PSAILISPLMWVSLEVLRYAVSGQLWNALGYSQAFHPSLIQSARWGGVYAASFLIVLVNAGVATMILKKWRPAVLLLGGAALIGLGSWYQAQRDCCRQSPNQSRQAVVVAIQPNVRMDVNDDAELASLLDRHLALSNAALNEIKNGSWGDLPRLVIW